MSLQKMLFAVCTAAALVAMVASQGINPEECSKNGRDVVTKWTQSMQSQAQQFAKEMVAAGQSQFNPDSFMEDINGLMSQYTSMMDTSSGINGQQMMQGSSKIVSSYMQIAQKYMNPDMSLKVMRLYMSMISSTMSSNTQLMMNLAQACMPSYKIFPETKN